MNLKVKWIKSILCILALSVIPALPQAAFALPAGGQESSGEVTSVQYLLFSDLAYCDLSACAGKSVSDIAEDSEILKAAKRTYLKNSTGQISTAEVLKKYVGDWVLDALFTNDETGFFACAFKNEKSRQIVITFRGTTDALGKDGLNDAEFGLMTVDAPQINDSLDLTRDYIAENAAYTFSATGHSLGGALANEVAQYYGWAAETFNAAQMTGTLYYDNAAVFGEVYRGFDTWNTLDHVNQHDLIVGTYEYGLYKNAVKHENESTTNKFFAHSVNHMLKIDEESGSISLSDTVGESDISSQNSMQITNAYGAVILGNTGANLLESTQSYGGLDVLYGGDGGDFLDAGGGSDTLIGGRGDDILDGSANNDIYIYYEGDGTDTILDFAGNDRLLVYSDGKITTAEDENYMYIYLEKELIVRLGKAARADSYSGKPENAKLTDTYYSFTLKQIKSDGSESEFEVKSENQSEIAHVTRIKVADSSIKLYSGSSVFFDSQAGETEFCTDGTGVYCFEDGSGSCTQYIYTKNESLQVGIINITAESLTVTKTNDNDSYTEYVPAAHMSFNVTNTDGEILNAGDEFLLDISTDVPALNSDSFSTVLTEVAYSDTSYLELSKSMLITTADRRCSVQVSVLGEAIDNEQIRWASTDESVAAFDEDGTIKTLQSGQASVIATFNGATAVCRIYVISPLYFAVLVIILLLLGALLVFLMACIVKHRIKRRRKRKAKKAAARAMTA